MNITTKALNRLREQIGNSKLGVLPDLGKPHAKGYRYTIGQHQDGSLARFWLGHNETEAKHKADAFLLVWADIVAAGGNFWTDDQIKLARQLADQKLKLIHGVAAKIKASAAQDEQFAQQKLRLLPALLPAAAPTVTAIPAVPGTNGAATVYGAIKAYLDSLDTKRVSPAHRAQTRHVLDRMKAVRSDCSLSDIDHRWLDTLADHFRARPISKTTGKALRPETVITTLRYIRTFFTWVDETEYGGWIGPRKLSRIFRVRRLDLMTAAELREAGTIKQFTVDQLCKLYKAGSNHQKAVMLTALFCGGTQMELSVLEKSEFDLVAGVLDHFRNKTKVPGRFWLPSELITLLKAEFKRHPKSPLAFLTVEGNPLVSFSGKSKVSDSVQQSWAKQRRKAKLPNALPFKYLRKFLGDYVTRHGGESLGQVALSHAPTSVLAKNYTSARDFDRFNQLQRQMYAELATAGMFEPAKKAAKRQAA